MPAPAWAIWSNFSYGFYSAGHLHQIRHMDVKPVENSGDLDLNLTIEALSLPKADRKDRLSQKPGRDLRLAKLDDYRGPIVKRDLFSPGLGRRGRSHREGTLDLAEYTYVTALVEAGGVQQVWLHDRLANKTWKLGEGDEFSVGQLAGTVRKINRSNEVIVDFDGHRRRLSYGQNLREGVEVAPDKVGPANETPKAGRQNGRPLIDKPGKDEKNAQTLRRHAETGRQN